MPRAPFNVLIFPYSRDAGEILYAVFRRSDSEEPFWQALSGGGEDSETEEEAARREAWEEARISPDHAFLRLDARASIPVVNPERRKLWGEDVFVIPEYCFAVEVAKDSVVLSEEHSDFRWLSFEDARDLLKWPSNKTALWELNERLLRKVLKDGIPTTTSVLLLHGSPGSGKSTLAAAIAEHLRQSDRAHAVIDLDDLSLVYPSRGRPFSHRNLKAIWPNYAAVPDLKVIIPTVIADAADHRSLRDAIHGATAMICELTAPKSVLIDRVTAREPNAYWQERLRGWVEIYHQRDESQKFGDFRVSTHDKTVEQAAMEIMRKAGWHPMVDGSTT